MTVGTLWAFLRMNNDDFNKALDSSMAMVRKFAMASMAAAGGIGAAYVVAGAAIVTAIGGAAFALAGLGIMAAAGREDVQKEFSGLKEHVGKTMQSISGPIANVLIGWGGELRRQFDTMAPLLETSFAAMAPNLKRMGDALIRPISEGFQKLIPQLVHIFTMITPGVEALGPKIAKGFDVVAKNIVPVFNTLLPTIKALFSGLGEIINGLVGFVRNLNTSVGDGVTYWQELMTIIGLLLPTLGSLVGAISKIGGIFLSQLVPVVKALVPILTEVFNFIGNNAPVVAQILEVFAALWVANWIRMQVIAMANAVRMAAAWFIALGPIGWIAAAVIAIVVLIILNWDKVKEWTIKIWGYIADFCVMVWGHIVDYAVLAFNKFIDFWVFLWNTVRDFVMGVINAVVDWITDHWKLIVSIIGGPMVAVVMLIITYWDQIKAFISAAIDFIIMIVTTGFNAVLSFIQTVWNGIKTVFETVLGIIVTIVTTYFNIYKTIIMTVFDAIKTVISTALDFIKLIIGTAWDFIKTATSTAWGFIKTIIDTFITGIKLAVDGLKTAVTTAVGAIVTTITGIKDTVVGFFKDAASWLFNAGKSIIEGLIKGIGSMAGAVKDAVGGIVKSARDLLPFSPAKEGPFSGKGWTLYSGQALMEGFAKGILSGGDSAHNALNSVLTGMNMAASPSFASTMSNGSLGMSRVGAGTTQVVFSGPVYADSSGIKRLVNQVEPVMRQRFSNAGKNNTYNLY
jgi:hypothetical protein